MSCGILELWVVNWSKKNYTRKKWKPQEDGEINILMGKTLPNSEDW